MVTKSIIPANIAEMLRSRGYKGEMPIGYHEAQTWLLEKYNVWLWITPLFLEVLGEETERLVWTIRAFDTSRHDYDEWCTELDIHDEPENVREILATADVKEHELWSQYQQYGYDSPEEAKRDTCQVYETPRNDTVPYLCYRWFGKKP